MLVALGIPVTTHLGSLPEIRSYTHIREPVSSPSRGRVVFLETVCYQDTCGIVSAFCSAATRLYCLANHILFRLALQVEQQGSKHEGIEDGIPN